MPGFHFKLPFGIQKVEKVNVNVYQKIELGYRSVGSADNFDIIESETKMITGDYNIVDVGVLRGVQGQRPGKVPLRLV